MSETVPMVRAFALVADLGMALGVRSIKDLPGLWVQPIDAEWTVAVNAKDRPLPHDGVEVPPGHAAFFFNGWPAGLVNASGGVLAAGKLANEQTLTAALRAAITRAGGTPTA